MYIYILYLYIYIIHIYILCSICVFIFIFFYRHIIYIYLLFNIRKYLCIYIYLFVIYLYTVWLVVEEWWNKKSGQLQWSAVDPTPRVRGFIRLDWWNMSIQYDWSSNYDLGRKNSDWAQWFSWEMYPENVSVVKRGWDVDKVIFLWDSPLT